jgi:hypothetical protein
MNISIENALLAITIENTGYQFTNTQSITINDPRTNTLAISPQNIGDGITYRTGTTTPVTMDCLVREVPADLLGLLVEQFAEQERVDVLVVDQLTGESYELSKSIIRTNPVNVGIAEGDGSFNVTLAFDCPSARFKYKPAEA